jgi:hypothetical protein
MPGSIQRFGYRRPQGNARWRVPALRAASSDQFRSLATTIDAYRARSFSLSMREIDPDRIAVMGA